MEHSFDIEIAKRYGIQPAILLKNIYFWIEKNKANETNFFDDHYWTYNSKKAFSELFPYMNARQIDYALKKLIDDGVLITGNYNKISYDRTLWYAITKKGYSILQNCEMDKTKMQNGSNENVQPIPDSKPDNKQTDNKPDINYQQIADMYNEICISYPTIRTLSEARKKAIKARINSGYTLDDFKEIFMKAEQSTFLKGGNDRNWAATFDWMLKDSNAVKILEGNYTDKAPAAHNSNANGLVEINGKQYIFKNGKYYVPNGNNIPVNPNAADDLPF